MIIYFSSVKLRVLRGKIFGVELISGLLLFITDTPQSDKQARRNPHHIPFF